MGTDYGHAGHAACVRSGALAALLLVLFASRLARADEPPAIQSSLLAFPADYPSVYTPPSTPASLPPLAPLPPTVLAPPKPSKTAIRGVELGPPQPIPLATPPALLKGDTSDVDYTTRRYEPAGFPLIGGNSDIGFQFGGVATLSRFANGIRPYAWNMDIVASTSIKSTATGTTFVQQQFLWHDDIVGLWEGRLRLNPLVSYARTVNEGYFGLGDASSGATPSNYVGTPGHYFEWIDSVATATIVPRLTISGPWFATGNLQFRFMDPSAYPDSKLARDAAARNPDGSPVIRGLGRAGLPALAVGAGYDSRDNEIFTNHGAYNTLAVQYTEGAPASAGIQYGEATLQVAGFRKLGPFVLAGRFTTDLEFGSVPFYDLLMAGVLGQFEATGGQQGVRGVPIGRYLGKVKVWGNGELRSMFLKFSLFHQKFSMGGDALVDVGRSWLDYSFKNPADGSGLGLKYGVGGGLYFVWGQAAIFRIDVAYSPDAQAENPSFPVGLYVASGTSF
jgi:hypothetical protein